MIAIPRPPRLADLSPERRATVLSLLSDERFAAAGLPADARLMYVVGALVCDDAGFARQSDVERAMADPSTIQCARTLLTKAGF